MRVRPRIWSIVVFGGCVLYGVLFAEDRPLLLGASVASGLTWLGFGALPTANRHNATRIAFITALATLLVTWATAMFAGLLYARYAAKDAGAKEWIPIMLIAATNIGGLVAVFRSAQTRTETSAALREVSDLRIAVLSAPLVEAADRATRAKTLEELAVSFGSMLQLSVNLTLLPRAIDQASLWALDEANGEWFICAATTPPREQQFKQKRLDRPTMGAGVVANLAAGFAVPELPDTVHEGDVYLIGSDLQRHPWYRPNPDHPHPAQGMATVLLRRNREPFGALCFTWEARVVPTQGPQTLEMIDILHRWAQAFGVALSRIHRLNQELER